MPPLNLFLFQKYLTQCLFSWCLTFLEGGNSENHKKKFLSHPNAATQYTEVNLIVCVACIFATYNVEFIVAATFVYYVWNALSRWHAVSGASRVWQACVAVTLARPLRVSKVGKSKEKRKTKQATLISDFHAHGSKSSLWPIRLAQS